jgi:hypothetical protein
MKYKIVDFYGRIYSHELESYGKYLNPKYTFKGGLSIVLLTSVIFRPIIIVLFSNNKLLCLKKDDIYIIIDENELHLLGTFDYDTIYELKEIINPKHTILSAVHSITTFDLLHENLIKSEKLVNSN